MARNHVEVTRLGRVVRCLLRNVVTSRVVGEVPVAGEDLTKDGVQWFFDSSIEILANMPTSYGAGCRYAGTGSLTEDGYASHLGRT